MAAKTAKALKKSSKAAKASAGSASPASPSADRHEGVKSNRSGYGPRWLWRELPIMVAVASVLGALAYWSSPSDSSAAQSAKYRETAPLGMVWIEGGSYQRGDEEFPDATPVQDVTLDGFYIDATEVTNAQFAEFVKATGYQTIAERPLDPKDFPGVPPDKLVPGSIVFTPPDHAVPLDNHIQWWQYVPGACWKHPEGPESSIEGRENHPVVQVCWEDAHAYAEWAGKRLPTEAEWEYAARGGLAARKYPWGDELRPDGETWTANIWQGKFPIENTKLDGYPRTAPVKSFAPNGYGVYDVGGNVWEWCEDWYRPDAYASSPRVNPQGPDDSFDPLEPNTPKRVQRGGSFLCTDQYCTRYMVGSRGKGEPKSAASHIGFRCAKSPATRSRAG